MTEEPANQGSIFNIGDLAKPVEILVSRTSDFIGAAFAPRQLVRMAKAKVEADRIEKLGNTETEIRERALQRLLAEEIRNQENIENIVHLALPEVTGDAKPEEISDDWLSLFFNKCKSFSDEEFQILWAKILAGEANQSGSFSKRTLEIVSSLEKDDAELFTKLCGFTVSAYDFYPLIYSLTDSIYKDKNIDFETLSHLDSVGLIHFYSSATITEDRLPKRKQYLYFDKIINVEFALENDNELDMGRIQFTKSGKELFKICNVEKVDGFLDYVVQIWTNNQYKVSVITK